MKETAIDILNVVLWLTWTIARETFWLATHPLDCLAYSVSGVGWRAACRKKALRKACIAAVR